MLPGARSPSQVVSFKPYFAVDYDSPSGNDDYTHQYGMVAWRQGEAVNLEKSKYIYIKNNIYIYDICIIYIYMFVHIYD